jgi:spore coat polysaccharide biosynthesis protein SpsF
MQAPVGIILQARLGSTRLPRKALAPLAGTTVIERCLQRLIRAGVGPLVLATTRLPEDDALVAIAQAMRIAIYRGRRDDVLDRYADAGRLFGFDVIIRATGDNPAVDIDAPRRVLEGLRRTGAEYACEDGLPCGAAVEAITVDALLRAAARATAPADREHVTSYVRNRPGEFRVVHLPAPLKLVRPDLRVTVDTPDDLQHVAWLFARAGCREPSLAALIAAADSSGRSPA